MSLLKRTVQVTFDLELEISEIGPDEIKVWNDDRTPAPEAAAQFTAMQNEMLRAIAGAPAVLRTLIRNWAPQEVTALHLDALAALVPEVDIEEANIVAPLVGGLSNEAGEYFRDAIERGLWWDASDELHDHLQLTPVRCTITEL